MRIPGFLAGLVLAALVLAGCGSGTNAYCSQLKADKKAFSGSTSSGDIEKEFKEFHKLAGKAPGEVSDDWKVIDNAVTTIEKDLKAAGVTFDQLVKAQSGQLPNGVDATKLQKVVSDLSRLSDSKFQKATKAIEKHAKKTCKVDLGASS